MTSAGEIEKRFRNNPELFTLKKHEATNQTRGSISRFCLKSKALTAVR